MANEEYKDYPKGRLAMGSGDLIDVYEVSHRTDSGETEVSTLRSNPSGSHGGKKTSEISFKSAISEEGFERDFHGKYRKREVVQLRLKLPGKTIVQVGRIASLEVMSNVDGFIDFTCTHKGKYEIA